MKKCEIHFSSKFDVPSVSYHRGWMSDFLLDTNLVNFFKARREIPSQEKAFMGLYDTKEFTKCVTT